MFGRHGTSARAGHNARARVLRYSSWHAVLRVSPAKPLFQQANTVDSATLMTFSLSTCLSRFSALSLSLSRGASLPTSLWFLLTGSWPKSCFGATSVLNDFCHNRCQILVDPRMSLQHSQGFWLVVLGKHCKTSFRNRVASRAVNTSWNKDEFFASC